MTASSRSICILLLAFVPFARAETKPLKQILFSGAQADEEIHTFMTKRWYRQAWQIEHKPIGGLSDGLPRWRVKGTSWWVRLDGPERLKGSLGLDGLDITQVYEFTGVAVDQCYGVLTFYVQSKPRIATFQESKTDDIGKPQTEDRSR